MTWGGIHAFSRYETCLWSDWGNKHVSKVHFFLFFPAQEKQHVFWETKKWFQVTDPERCIEAHSSVCSVSQREEPRNTEGSETWESFYRVTFYCCNNSRDRWEGSERSMREERFCGQKDWLHEGWVQPFHSKTHTSCSSPSQTLTGSQSHKKERQMLSWLSDSPFPRVTSHPPPPASSSSSSSSVEHLTVCFEEEREHFCCSRRRRRILPIVSIREEEGGRERRYIRRKRDLSRILHQKEHRFLGSRYGDGKGCCTHCFLLSSSSPHLLADLFDVFWYSPLNLMYVPSPPTSLFFPCSHTCRH